MTQPMVPVAGATAAPQGDMPARRPEPFSLLFSARPSACQLARHHLATMLGVWELAHLSDTAQLMASELLANAVTAAQDTAVPPGGPQVIQFRMGRAAASLIIEVWDPSPEPPVARLADSMDEGGRGLYIVEALSAAWGFYRPQSGGKVVWCQIHLDDEPGPAASQPSA